MKMEPNKIEKQFREKLNAREIQPSAQAWDRLDAMLSVAEEKKTRKPFGFLFIAASILVFATLGTFLFNQNGSEINTTNPVVGTETKIDSIQNKTESFQSPLLESQKQNGVVATSEVQPTTDNRQLTIKKEGVSINNQSANNQNPIINREKSIEFQNSSDVAQKELPKIMDTKEIVVGKKEINSKSDESLLADLDKSAKATANQKSNLKVDAKSLLSQVDGEVEHSFREKVFTKINKNYQEIKVALANRNNE
ncbi:hypothetical protein [Flavobacterium sedimenticola]|uniref:Anti-sigma factor n=1 Tax=Flavobacterium sedimenticola TaxID=3043286 RepID=A0ABT6XRT0_9FLAO|nr:hypothetical protein [Flavobacterium sedimenticola]MDI9257798.1 hypothetical protein [Flavobacterium sedimenticola]